MEFLNEIQYWHWIAFGAVLIVVEIFAPGGIFLWPALAAIVVGLISYIAPDIGQPFLLLLWGISSIILVVGWLAYKKRHPGEDTKSTINRRGEQYVGRHFTLSKDIVNGVGELHVDDTRWKIVSHQDKTAGSKVKVVAVEGTSLRVEEFIS